MMKKRVQKKQKISGMDDEKKEERERERERERKRGKVQTILGCH